MSVPLPVLDRPLDNTALSAYMACPREYYLGMVLHRREGGGTSAPLAFGSLIHKILEVHYRTGGAVDLAELVARNWWEKHGHHEEGDYRTLERALLDYKRYMTKWGKAPDEEQGWTVGYPDSPMVEMPFNIEAKELSWAGKIDRIIELGGLHYIEDHKTTSRLDANYFRSFELSNQMMGYTWAGQHIAPQLRISGVRLNVWHILKEKSNFERQLFTYTKGQIAEWERNTKRWTKKIQQSMQEWPDEATILAGGAEWPEAHWGDNGCSRKYGLCGYNKLCGIDEAFRHKLLAELPLNPWNPLDLED